MSQERAGLQRQIEDLSAEVARLNLLIKELDRRQAVIGRRPQVRIGETIQTSGGGYPLPNSGFNTFGVRFKDPSFDETEGDRSLDGNWLSDEDQRIARVVPAAYVEEGTPVFIVEFDGKHYIINGSGELGEERWIVGSTVGSISAGGSGTVNRISGYNESVITAHLLYFHGSQGISADKQVGCRWFSDLAQWVIMHAECET
jgi:hypothetical protein